MPELESQPATDFPISFSADPEKYRHWRVEYDGPICRAYMQVDPEHPLKNGYELKLNSYDLGVDIELADFVRRLRFEHPEVKTLIIASGHAQVFCAGANIGMLGLSSHAWKVNFCKFTNETRCELEDLANQTGLKTICAVTGPCAGGGYELALACDEIWLIDDGNSAVSLPETPLLGVLPGTGGLTRLVDKRKVRRDRADVFCTVAEGVKGKRAVKWGLVDQLAPRSKFWDQLNSHAKELADAVPDRGVEEGVEWTSIDPKVEGNTIRYSTLTAEYQPEERTATITVEVPSAESCPQDAAAMQAEGCDFWPLRFARELEHAILDLRINHSLTGLCLLRSKGSLDDMLQWDSALLDARGHWFVDQTIHLLDHVIQRVERSSCSFFALIEEGSCFGGSLLDLALASDRVYMLDADGVEIARNEFNDGLLPMTTGITRTACRLLGETDLADSLRGNYEKLDGIAAEDAGLVTEALDDIDFEDTVRIQIEERISLSPDSLTGMEANLRFAGPETMKSKIFGRLSAWQNWIFIRPNATGPHGALTLYGKPERPQFEWSRV